MKTPYLLIVPKSGPTKRERLQQFKKEHGIFCHDCGQKDYDNRWTACLLQQCHKQFLMYCRGETKEGMPEEELFFVLISHACRLMDESGLMISAATEMEALRVLCHENKINFPF